MAFAPIAFVIPEYDRNLYKNWWLKAYEPGTTTPKTMATDPSGNTTASRYELNNEGFPVTSGSALVIPHIDGNYDLWLFPTAVEADANNTTNALQLADNTGIISAINTSPGVVLSADTVADMKTKDLQSGQTISTKGYNAEGDDSGAKYLIQTAGEFGGIPDEINDHTLNNGNIAAIQGSSFKSINITPRDVPPADNSLFIRDVINDPTDQATTVQIQRQVNSSTSANPKAIRAVSIISAGVDSVEWAISGELENNSDAVNGGATALSGVSLKNAKGNTFGGHFQVKDTTGEISSIGGSMIGQELNIQANGADDAKVRVGYDIIARTYQPNFAAKGAGEFHAAIRIRNSALGAEGGKWNNAILIEDGVQAIPVGLRMSHSPGTGTGAGVEDSGDKARGIDLKGQYGVAAIDLKNANLTSNDILIRLKDRGKIEFTTGVTLKWEGSLPTPSLQFDGQPTQLTVGASGSASTLPAQPAGYFKIQLNGNNVVLPFYNQ